MGSAKDSWRRALLHQLMQNYRSRFIASQYTFRRFIAVTCGSRRDLSLACNETLHIWFPVFNPDFRRYGPGHLLFFRIFEHGSARGIRWFDFGEGEAIYKSRYHGESYALRKGVIRLASMRGYSGTHPAKNPVADTEAISRFKVNFWATSDAGGRRCLIKPSGGKSLGRHMLLGSAWMIALRWAIRLTGVVSTDYPRAPPHAIRLWHTALLRWR